MVEEKREEQGGRTRWRLRQPQTRGARAQKNICVVFYVSMFSLSFSFSFSPSCLSNILSLLSSLDERICDCLSDKIKVQSHSQSDIWVLWLSKSEYQKVNLLFLKGCLCLFLFFLPLHAGRENFSFQEGDEDDDAD